LESRGQWINKLLEKNIVKEKDILTYLEYAEMESLSEMYGWLPSEIRKEKIIDMEMYKAILKGKIKTKEYMSNKKLRRL